MEEIAGGALALGISRDVAVAINFVYELSSFCTSVIVKL